MTKEKNSSVQVYECVSLSTSALGTVFFHFTFHSTQAFCFEPRWYWNLGDIVTTCRTSWQTTVADKLTKNILASQDNASRSQPQ